MAPRLKERYQKEVVPALVKELAKLHLFILVVVSHVVITDQVRDPGNRYRGLELVRLSNQPVAQLPTVADSFNSHAFALDP